MPNCKIARIVVYSFLAIIIITSSGCLSVDKRKGIIIAHRGASAYLPENTLAAKALAYGMNPNFLEQDVVLTRDDQVIVLHDIHLDTVTNVEDVFPNRVRQDGRFYAIDFSLAEIKSLRVTERMTLKTKTAVYPKRFPVFYSNFQIPTLIEEIELLIGLNKSTGKSIGLYTEIKSPAWHRKEGKDISRIVLKVLKNKGFETKFDNIYVQCFDPQEMKRIRFDLGSQLKLIQLIGENEWNEAETDYKFLQTPEGLKEIATYADGIAPWIPQVLQKQEGAMAYGISSLIRNAHTEGLSVHVYTLRADDLPSYVSSFQELVRAILLEANADGIFTDFPDSAVAVRDSF